MRKNNYRFLSRRYLKLFKPLILLFVVFGVPAIIFNRLKLDQYMKVTQIETRGTFQFVNKQDFENILSNLVIQQNIFTLKSPSVEKALQQNFLGLKKVDVQKKYWTKIIAVVQERLPAATVIDSAQEKYLVDADGYVLGIVGESYFDLPTIYTDEKLFVGQFLDASLVPLTMEIINQAKIAEVPVASISYKPQYSTFYVKNSIVVMIQNTTVISEAMKIIASLVMKAQQEGKNIAKIDLRYDKVIVLYD